METTETQIQKKRVPESIKELRSLCQKTAPNPGQESWVGLFSRRFSIYSTKLLLTYTSLTPNQITIVSVLVFFAGVACFYFGNYWWNLLGSLIIFVSIVLDGSDGEVARYTKKGKMSGTLYTEPVSHDIQYGISFLLLGLFLSRIYNTQFYLLVGAVASLTKLLYRLLQIRFWSLQHNTKSVQEQREISEKIKQDFKDKKFIVKLMYWINKNLFSSTAVFLVLFLGSLFGFVNIALLHFAVGYSVLFLALFAKQVVKIYKENL